MRRPSVHFVLLHPEQAATTQASTKTSSWRKKRCVPLLPAPTVALTSAEFEGGSLPLWSRGDEVGTAYRGWTPKHWPWSLLSAEAARKAGVWSRVLV